MDAFGVSKGLSTQGLATALKLGRSPVRQGKLLRTTRGELGTLRMDPKHPVAIDRAGGSSESVTHLKTGPDGRIPTYPKPRFEGTPAQREANQRNNYETYKTRLTELSRSDDPAVAASAKGRLNRIHDGAVAAGRRMDGSAPRRVAQPKVTSMGYTRDKTRSEVIAEFGKSPVTKAVSDKAAKIIGSYKTMGNSPKNYATGVRLKLKEMKKGANVSKSKSSDAAATAAGAGVGAAAGGGALAAGRTVWNAENLPRSAMTSVERTISRGKKPDPHVRAYTAVDSKGRATPVHVMLPGSKSPTRAEGWGRRVPSSIAGIQRMSGGKKAALVLAPAAVTAAAVGGAKKIHDRRVSTGA